MSELTYSFSYQNPAGSSSATVNFQVIQFAGTEAISSLYRYTITLLQIDASTTPDLINGRATLHIEHNSNEARLLHGIITSARYVKLISSSDGSSPQAVVEVVLEPELAKLNYCENNAIYPRIATDSGEDILTTLVTLLSDLGWTQGTEYVIDCSNSFRVWNFRLQYAETGLAFLNRILQREGIFYYFKNVGGREQVVFTDNTAGFTEMNPSVLSYAEKRGVNVSYEVDEVQSINPTHQFVPHRVTVANFNDDMPSLDISDSVVMDTNSHGSLDLFGLNILSSTEATEVANLYANSYLCRKKSLSFETDTYAVFAGAHFKFAQYPITELNGTPVVIESLECQGATESLFAQANMTYSGEPSFKADCVALYKDLTYAPKQTHNKPQILKTMIGVITGDDTQTTPQLDVQGRYKVKFLFSQSTDSNNATSYYVRKSESYGGDGEGIHFPLLVGTRVLVGFIEGDPDRPVIVGTMTDAGSQQSLVTENNNAENLIQTAAGNKLNMNDTSDSQAIELSLPSDNGSIKLSIPDFDDVIVEKRADIPDPTINGIKGLAFHTTGIERRDIGSGLRIEVHSQFIEDAKFEIPRLNYYGQMIPQPTLTDRASWESSFGETLKDRATQKKLSEEQYTFSLEEELSGNFIFERRCANRFEFGEGNRYIFGDDRVYDFGDSYEEFHSYMYGIDLNDEHFDIPPVKNDLYDATKDPQPNKYANSRHDRAVNPEDHSVSKRWGDQFNYHHGRRFEWCDAPADYNFSNGYTENLVNSNTEAINAEHDEDMAKPPGPDYDDINGSLVTGLASGSTVATKTIGNTYDYRHGENLSVIVGNSEEHVHGNTHSHVRGDSETKIEGSSVQQYFGGARNHHHGAAASFYMGAFSDMYFGVTNSMSLTGSSTSQLGFSVDAYFGIKSEFKWGAEVDLGTFVTQYELTRIEGRKLRIKAVASEVDNGMSKIANTLSKIQGVLHHINNTSMAAENSKVKIRCQIADLQTSAAVKMIN